MYLRALTRFEKAWGPEHTSKIEVMNNLELSYSKQSKIVKTEAI